VNDTRLLTGHAWIVIPAFREQGKIGSVVNSVRVSWPNVVVVDDGSNDGTGQEASTAGAIVLRHMVNLGQGAALQTGITFALQKSADYIVTFDADGQHNSTEIELLLSTLCSSGADVALGSRFLGKSIGMPASRRILLRLATWFTYLTAGLKTTDAHNGFRAMTRRAAQQINLRENRMAHASEIIHEIADHKLSWIEVPVTISYTGYSINKGQRVGGAIDIVVELLVRKIRR
jgi:polyprenyl-phospho-N-acetylgalactosaminyl synthase